MKKLSKKYYPKALTIVLIVIFSMSLVNTAWAENGETSPKGTDYGLKQTIDKAKDLDTGKTLPEAVGLAINYLFGILGTIFLIVILIGGYKWMTAGGNEEKIEAAKKLVISGVNGMILIFLAYALAYAIIYALTEAIQKT